MLQLQGAHDKTIKLEQPIIPFEAVKAKLGADDDGTSGKRSCQF
jgi:hypothetical protein